jgi:hypothetical protein
MSDIIWPEEYIPGTTDNFVSNEIIVKGLSADEVWPYLQNATAWPSYYSNASQIEFLNCPGPELRNGSLLRFTTFGLPVHAEVMECEPPATGKPARLAWRGWAEGDAMTRIDTYHAWLIEDLPGGRVRILTQESQLGNPAKRLALTKPNPMLNAHQDWIEGLARIAAQELRRK